MKMQVNEISKLTGVSVRTLHYYDEIGLLKPIHVDEQNGYRYYDNTSLMRMQEILFYRELDFPLKTIQKILSSPDYNKTEALQNQKNLLMLKKQRIERLIEVIESAEKGDNNMSFNAFDNSEYENAQQKYAKEAEKRWGNTDAYKESVQKTAGYSKEQQVQIGDEMTAIFAEFAEHNNNGGNPEDEQSQALVKKWQDFITEYYYNCTNEILAGLGEMYTADERFMKNIDKSGAGTAEFISKAIKSYCMQ